MLRSYYEYIIVKLKKYIRVNELKFIKNKYTLCFMLSFALHL